MTDLELTITAAEKVMGWKRDFSAPFPVYEDANGQQWMVRGFPNDFAPLTRIEHAAMLDGEMRKKGYRLIVVRHFSGLVSCSYDNGGDTCHGIVTNQSEPRARTLAALRACGVEV